MFLIKGRHQSPNAKVRKICVFMKCAVQITKKAKISLHENDQRLSYVDLARKHAVEVVHQHITSQQASEHLVQSRATLKRGTKERENSTVSAAWNSIRSAEKTKSYIDMQTSPIPKVFEYSVGRHASVLLLLPSRIMSVHIPITPPRATTGDPDMPGMAAQSRVRIILPKLWTLRTWCIRGCLQQFEQTNEIYICLLMITTSEQDLFNTVASLLEWKSKHIRHTA